MKIIEKKILTRFFTDVVLGLKTFEFRKDEDDIQQGDIIFLKEVDDEGQKTGNKTVFVVGVTLRHSDWADIPDGFCVISLAKNVAQYFCFREVKNGKV